MNRLIENTFNRLIAEKNREEEQMKDEKEEIEEMEDDEIIGGSGSITTEDALYKFINNYTTVNKNITPEITIYDKGGYDIFINIKKGDDTTKINYTHKELMYDFIVLLFNNGIYVNRLKSQINPYNNIIKDNLRVLENSVLTGIKNTMNLNNIKKENFTENIMNIKYLFENKEKDYFDLIDFNKIPIISLLNKFINQKEGINAGENQYEGKNRFSLDDKTSKDVNDTVNIIKNEILHETINSLFSEYFPFVQGQFIKKDNDYTLRLNDDMYTDFKNLDINSPIKLENNIINFDIKYGPFYVFKRKRLDLENRQNLEDFKIDKYSIEEIYILTSQKKTGVQESYEEMKDAIHNATNNNASVNNDKLNTLVPLGTNNPKTNNDIKSINNNNDDDYDDDVNTNNINHFDSPFDDKNDNANNDDNNSNNSNANSNANNSNASVNNDKLSTLVTLRTRKNETNNINNSIDNNNNDVNNFILSPFDDGDDNTIVIDDDDESDNNNNNNNNNNDDYNQNPVNSPSNSGNNNLNNNNPPY